MKNDDCLKCKKETDVFGCRFCADCWYPGIDEEYNEYMALLEEGYPSHKAAVMSGYKGAEEI